MLSNYPVTAARTVNHVGDGDDASLGLFSTVMLKLRQWLCALHGHDSLLHFEHDRMFLRCTSCGHDTPGWEIGSDVRPDVRFREASRRAVPRLVGVRKVA